MIPGFMNSMLIGGADNRALVLIDRTTGTNIGDMTASGGLAAAFDGATNQASASGARKVSSANGFVGKTMAASRCIGQAIIYGGNDVGYTGATNVEIRLYAKNGAAPANGLDGTIIGTTGSFTDVNSTNSKVISSTDLYTVWDHVWVTVIPSASNTTNMAELQLYAWE